VTSKLPAPAEYELSLAAPSPGLHWTGCCSSCHLPGQHFTDVNDGTLHAPDETGMDPAYAARTATKQYRTTPWRGLWQHAPYFHDGSAATLEAVVSHYDEVMTLRLSPQQQADLVAYLKGL
jgi:cytochrome c peroxidase